MKGAPKQVGSKQRTRGGGITSIQGVRPTVRGNYNRCRLIMLNSIPVKLKTMGVVCMSTSGTLLFPSGTSPRAVLSSKAPITQRKGFVISFQTDVFWIDVPPQYNYIGDIPQVYTAVTGIPKYVSLRANL